MVTTRSHDHDGDAAPSTGEKRAMAAGASGQGSEPKKQKTEHHGSERSGHRHERKVVVQPGEGQEAPKQEEGADVKKEEETPAPKEDQPATATASKSEAKPEEEEQDTKEESKSEPEAAAEEGNAEEGQVPQHEPNPDPERKHGVLERGHIYFLYRPKVQVDHPASLDDVSKFHILLVPHGTKFHRLIAVGKKALPEASESTRPIWGEVLNVGEDLKALKEGLGSYTYETKTQGTRHQPGARVAGSGAYVLHAAENYPQDSTNASAVYHTYLVYELALPHQLGDVQHALHIHEEGGMTLQVKNPDAPSTNPAVRNKPESKQPKYPDELLKLFKTRFIPADPPALLDYPGVELLLIPSKHTPEQDTSRKAKEELDREEQDVEGEIARQSDGGEAKKALKEMGMEGLIDGAALEGHWE